MLSLKSMIRIFALASCLLLTTACSDAGKNSEEVAPDAQTTDQSSEQEQLSASQTTERQQAKRTNSKSLNKLEVVKGQPTSKLATDQQNCEQLSQQACLASTSCELEQGANKGYFCREAKDQCEIGFAQNWDDPKGSCQAEKGCTYLPGSCFCPDGVQCVCGGGKPPSCKSIGKSAEF